MDNKDRMYSIGRLMAALEAAGVLGQQPERKVGRAITEPGVIIPPAIADLIKSGSADYIAPIMEALPPDGLRSGPVPMADRFQYWLGYYAQSAELRAGGMVGTGRTDAKESPLDVRLIIRIDPDLKEWALQNGGAALVRALLRRERASREDRR